ncbi:bmp family protein [Pelagibacterium halotolerans B2]|uniref:Bmp family protein n=1 Tax=Pelagibacterium halotolerans (strain DSM 22347 / JCM 15775 / CGMCC 1.7692 / B2) TaxID=1082931 RepID=G4R8E2_PELHB|nr:bmp family protein [Pelagibacterium halotolerans B2]
MIADQFDSPITIAQTAEQRGVYVIGKDVDVMDRAPEAVLTGVSWNWGPMMLDLVEEIHAGTWEPSPVRSDLAGGAAVLDPFNDVIPADFQAEFSNSRTRSLLVNSTYGPARSRPRTELLWPVKARRWIWKRSKP